MMQHNLCFLSTFIAFVFFVKPIVSWPSIVERSTGSTLEATKRAPISERKFPTYYLIGRNVSDDTPPDVVVTGPSSSGGSPPSITITFSGGDFGPVIINVANGGQITSYSGGSPGTNPPPPSPSAPKDAAKGSAKDGAGKSYGVKSFIGDTIDNLQKLTGIEGHGNKLRKRADTYGYIPMAIGELKDIRPQVGQLAGDLEAIANGSDDAMEPALGNAASTAATLRDQIYYANMHIQLGQPYVDEDLSYAIAQSQSAYDDCSVLATQLDITNNLLNYYSTHDFDPNAYGGGSYY